MKKFILLSILLFTALALPAQKKTLAKGGNFTLSGTLKGLKKGTKLYLSHKYDNKAFTDTIVAAEEKFNFKGNTPEPNMYWIEVANKPENVLLFFVDKGNVTIQGSLDAFEHIEVKGGSTQEDYNTYTNIIKAADLKKAIMIEALNKLQATNDTLKILEKLLEYQQIDNETANQMTTFIAAHPASAVSGYIIAFFPTEKTYTALDSIYSLLDPALRDTKYGKIAAEKISQVKSTSVGFVAQDFTLNDLNDKPISLLSYRGKYVLVDFWASWCGPCRAENPNVVAAYNEFKDKGFDILGVSLDEQKDKWVKAVEKDQLAWIQVSDLKGWSNEVAMKYGVRSIPSNFLLDKEGKIIAKNLRGKDLKAKLSELLNSK